MVSTEVVHRRRQHWAAAILLFSILAIVHYDVVFLGRSLVYSDFVNPVDWRPLPDNYGADQIPFSEWSDRDLHLTANIRDADATLLQWEPSTAFLREAIRTGEWPFWDPYIAAGTPAMANLVPAFFFPPYVAVVALGASVGLRTWYFLALVWGAAFFTYLFLRRHGLTMVASFFGGVLVLLCGGTNQMLGSFMGQTVSCLPVALYATRAYLDGPTGRRMAALAAVYASVALASFPPLLVAIFGIVACYALIAIVIEQPDISSRMRSAGGWVATAGLSIGLVGFYYGPVLALRQDAPHVALLYQGVALQTMPLHRIFQLLSPTVAGGGQIYANGPFAVQSQPYIPYVGTIAVLCAVLARPAAIALGRTLWISSVAAIVVLLLKLFGVPPVQWIANVPLFSQIHMAFYFGVPLGFLVAMLAAMGIDNIQRGHASIPRTVVAAAAVLVSLEALWRLAADSGVLGSPVMPFIVRDWKFLIAVTVAASVVAVIGCTIGRTARQRGLVTATLLGLAVVEGVYNNWYPNPRRWDPFTHPVPFVRLLQGEADRGRMFSFSAPEANVNEAFDVSALGSMMAFNPPRIYDVYQKYAVGYREVFLRFPTRIPPEPVLDRANVLFVGVPKARPEIVREAADRRYRVRFDDGYLILYERPTQPRFFYSSDYRIASKDEALDAIATAPPRQIVVESPPGVPLAPNEPTDPAIGIESRRRNSITLTVDAPRPGLVYASDSYFTGWHARVNGVEVPILPANYAFRAVAVPAGHSKVEFHYWPPGLNAGLAASGATLMLLFGLLLADRPSLSKQEPPADPA
jgi:hypothetical protein